MLWWGTTSRLTKKTMILCYKTTYFENNDLDIQKDHFILTDAESRTWIFGLSMAATPATAAAQAKQEPGSRMQCCCIRQMSSKAMFRCFVDPWQTLLMFQVDNIKNHLFKTKTWKSGGEQAFRSQAGASDWLTVKSFISEEPQSGPRHVEPVQ